MSVNRKTQRERERLVIELLPSVSRLLPDDADVLDLVLKCYQYADTLLALRAVGVPAEITAPIARQRCDVS